MVFYTETKSAYEVDLTRFRVRRLRGAKDPTRSFEKDGEWKEYAKITSISVGLPVLIIWRQSNLAPTLTSHVEHISDGEN